MSTVGMHCAIDPVTEKRIVTLTVNDCASIIIKTKKDYKQLVQQADIITYWHSYMYSGKPISGIEAWILIDQKLGLQYPYDGG